MIIFLPSYYKRFKCIAERCRHSCCIGWEIGVDSETFKKYEALGREDILCHIKNGEIILCEDGRCPFLCGDGLCRLISELGDSFTSVICREHPRFYHRVGERVEGGIGISCEEAARIILSSDGYADFGTAQWHGKIAEETDFDTIRHREIIYSFLKKDEISYSEKLQGIRDNYDLAEKIHTEEEWNNILSELEYLDEGHRGLLRISKADVCAEMQPYFERFFAYLVFRHVTVAGNYENLRARIGFCLLLTHILENLATEEKSTFTEICDFARIISEEIEYSEDNTDALIFEIECSI